MLGKTNYWTSEENTIVYIPILAAQYYLKPAVKTTTAGTSTQPVAASCSLPSCSVATCSVATCSVATCSLPCCSS